MLDIFNYLILVLAAAGALVAVVNGYQSMAATSRGDQLFKPIHRVTLKNEAGLEFINVSYVIDDDAKNTRNQIPTVVGFALLGASFFTQNFLIENFGMVTAMRLSYWMLIPLSLLFVSMLVVARIQRKFKQAREDKIVKLFKETSETMPWELFSGDEINFIEDEFEKVRTVSVGSAEKRDAIGAPQVVSYPTVKTLARSLKKIIQDSSDL